jgi:DNA polymerase/3'-5' exonuclease PolX
MGVCQFEGECHHRIDIRFYPLEEYSFALMYFTGSMMFNRSIRLHAISLGLQLSDLGVVPK